MNNKSTRELKEMQNLFADPKFARHAWKSVGAAIALQPATRPTTIVNRDGNETSDSLIENYTYQRLCKDIKSLGKENREPTELEMILACQMVKARTDTSAAVFIRDTLGAKPIDESKMDATVSNPYEQLTDEELELIAESRRKKAIEQATPEAVPEAVTAASTIVTGDDT